MRSRIWCAGVLLTALLAAGCAGNPVKKAPRQEDIRDTLAVGVIPAAQKGQRVVREAGEDWQEVSDSASTEEQAVCPHDFQKVYWPGAATCTTEGAYTFQCSICGQGDGTGTHTEPVLPHDYVATKLQQGNCVEHTRIEYVCRSCGAGYTDAYLETDDHDWVEGIAKVWNIETQTIDEVSFLYCSRCHLQRRTEVT